MCAFLMALIIFAANAGVLLSPSPPQESSPNSPAAALELIRRQRYDDAINRLELALEATPDQPDALTYLATAQLYSERDFLKAQKLFEAAFQAGGGATFFVQHSHETLGTGDLADYCRGWLHLRKNEVRFVPDEGEHGFTMSFSDITEFQQNRFKKTLFHIKRNGKNQNFRPRTGEERETLLILVLYKKFAR